MRPRSCRVLWLCLCLPVGVLACGCGEGEKAVPVRGKVRNKGAPMPVKEMVGRLRVTFRAVTDDPKQRVDPQEALVNPDGTFTVPGPKGKGIAPGKYRIAVTWQDNFPLGPDHLKGAFSETNTRIVRDVGENTEIDIDVSRPEG